MSTAISNVVPSGLENLCATDREQCGVLVQNGDSIKVVICDNAADKDSDYAITFEEVERVWREIEPGESIVGFFHTHLPHHPCKPSEGDLEGAIVFPDFLHLIYKPSTNELCWYDESGEVVDEA